MRLMIKKRTRLSVDLAEVYDRLIIAEILPACRNARRVETLAISYRPTGPSTCIGPRLARGDFLESYIKGFANSEAARSILISWTQSSSFSETHQPHDAQAIAIKNATAPWRASSQRNDSSCRINVVSLSDHPFNSSDATRRHSNLGTISSHHTRLTQSLGPQGETR